MILSNARILAGDGLIPRGWLQVRGRLIDGYGSGPPPAALADIERDLEGRWLLPGFVDIHTHGAVGHSFDEADSESGTTAVDAVVDHHRAHGTTTLLGSLVTAPLADLERRVSALSSRVTDGTLAGIHLEGPFLSAARCGAHAPEHLRPPSDEAIERLLAVGNGTVRMITIAPELPGAIDAIARIVRAGVVAAVGHTNADYETVQTAIDAGATIATHLYNGMPPIAGRAPGPVPALLHDPRVTVELIADGFHLHPITLRHAAEFASERFTLVSDAMAATGIGDGDYLLGTQRVRVTQGQARLIDGDSLAGSTLTLSRALRTAVAAGIGMQAAVGAVTATPARAVGLSEGAGTIAVSRIADLVILDEDLSLSAVMRGGEFV